MIFWSGQLTYEEKFVKKHNIKPIHALGLEGFFSLIILSLILVVFNFLKVPFDMGQPDGQMEDVLDGFIQLKNNHILLSCFIGATIMLVFASISGITISRQFSAVHRIVLDSGRMFVVWAVSLAIPAFDQELELIHILGFILIITGILVFNDVVFGKLFKYCYM